MSKGEINRRRLMSKAQQANQYTTPDDKARLEAGLPIGIWRDHYLRMAEKTAEAALAKRLPKNKYIEKYLNLIETDLNDAIDSTATTVDTPQVPLPAPAVQPQPEPVADTTPTPPPHSEQAADNNIEDGNFTEVPENVDVETGEVLTPTTTPKVVFTGDKYVKGAIASMTTNNDLVEFWETVPTDVKTKYQELFEEKQDLLRYV
jgi:hypothetical protein